MSSELQQGMRADHCVGHALALTLASCFEGEASEIFHQSSSGAALDATAVLESKTDNQHNHSFLQRFIQQSFKAASR